jgi:ABC-type lipoprotein release transport system permease subunit
VIYVKLLFGGFGRRGLEAITAMLVVALSSAIIAAGLMIITGSYDALLRAEREDRPDIIQIKGRFNRAVFETPRRGHLPPITLPVYEPLIDPRQLLDAGRGAAIVMRQSLLRNVVSPDGFLNLYVFGIEPDLERKLSVFSVAQGRFLEPNDLAEAVLDHASAGALSVKVGDSIAIRSADGTDLPVSIVGILDNLALRDAPPRTVEAPALYAQASLVSSGVFITLRTSQRIFGRSALTDALLVAPNPTNVPALVDRLRQTFRLEPGIFVTDRFDRFRRKTHDFVLAVTFFSILNAAATGLAGVFVVDLLHDVYRDRRRQHAILAALGLSPVRNMLILLGLGLSVTLSGAIIGTLAAVSGGPARFAMPSMMADLGVIEPHFSAWVGGLVATLSVSAVGFGLAPTAWRLLRTALSGGLSGAQS